MTAQPDSRLAILRQTSQAMLDARDEAALRRQPRPELSPLLWHVGHVFFVENYWLAERVFGDTSVTDRWRRLYFPEACDKQARSARLPGPDSMRRWTAEIAAINDRYWAHATPEHHDLLRNGYLHAFICQHYAQHIETMRMAAAQLDLASDDGAAALDVAEPVCNRRVSVPSRRVRLGTDSIDAYDNEKPTHERDVERFDIAGAPVSNAEWLGFMNAGGYDRHEFWDDDGWRWRCRHGIEHPQHWRPAENGWRIAWRGDPATLAEAPVHGIGWYEARAFARYAQARLPTEHEWEAAVRADKIAAAGQVWEWCDNAFKPYPGFTAFPYDGYSKPWFDGHHYVARGSSRHTEPEIKRAGFRNFYPPTHRHVFAGLRLAW
ncbi:SUMF1/EgtB/PvdO family nonheme iron enzyme [Salinisphaera sp.]|uniref:SUMF1/EgtB/PvdO family nonheme iron enzyme n=1 Tax=Salinisphaera sp. TaxID=1914330 RepID=UPI002D768319|nr:SUMF1/EgtB/PvdO family nonheme iron enzyme [Salinisphaera sp.]HET7313079.1 SUMF1/EgtB/PvdO family nonheme iron enzyme [Salinisphaera sp.]